MPGQPISITRGPTTVTATSVQPGREALDLTGMPGLRFDFNLRAVYVDGASTSGTVTIQTSMTNDDNPNNWEDLVTFSAITASNATQIGSATTGVLRYVRWSLNTSGATPNITFEVLGMAW